MSNIKLLKLYQELGIDEVIAKTPVNRLDKNSGNDKETYCTGANLLGAGQFIIPQVQIEDLSLNNHIINLNNMSQSEAISRLVKKQGAGTSGQELKSVADIVKEVRQEVDNINNLADLEK